MAASARTLKDLPPVAALPMYDWPAVRHANDALWRRLAKALGARGLDAPDELERSRPVAEIWRDGGLLLAQTCGYPFVTQLRDRVRLVATPCYAVPGCHGSDYSSHIIVRRDEPVDALGDMAGRTVAINGTSSQSGFAALQASVAALHGPAPFFSAVRVSGSHLGSMRAVAAGEADLAAVDAVCWALARRDCPEVSGDLKSIARTAPTPGLPFVTAAARPDAEVAQIADALAECLADPATADARNDLFLSGLERVPAGDYCAAFCRLSDRDAEKLMPAAPAAVHQADNATIAHGRRP